jgi:AraC-like DNA-binding protein
MKKEDNAPLKFESLSEAHQALGLPGPKHPLISLINNSCLSASQLMLHHHTHVLNVYKISYKPKLSGKARYGQGLYDFSEGGLMFAAPGQIVGPTAGDDSATASTALYTLLIHPDFLWNYPLAKKIRQYGFFSYSANEALHLSEEEKTTILSIFKMIGDELNSKIDDFSQDVVISEIELLLTFADRFYKRQFITRKAASHDLLQKLEELLNGYFSSQQSEIQGLPSVAYLAGQLNVSPSYLSDMLRSLTGQNAQQHIHERLIEKAKEILSTTNLSVSEVAYALGFEHSQSFSKLFKTKTNQSPLEFRRSFN